MLSTPSNPFDSPAIREPGNRDASSGDANTMRVLLSGNADIGVIGTLNVFASIHSGASIRAIVAKARVNQAAINYHFDGKDGLYREVLRGAFRALTEQQIAHIREMKAMSREEAVAEFIGRQLHPLMARDEYSRHMRLFNWETVRPTAVFRALVSEEAAPFMGLAGDLVRRFMPDADQRTVTVAAIWLVGQCSVFLRNREQLAEPPMGLVLDDTAVEWLAATISRWVVEGLGKRA